jgi:ATP-dependent Clp protease ATP-binding subunit ClpA
MDNFFKKLMALDSQLINEVPNLEKAIVSVVRDLRQHYAGLGDPDRAAGIYLLLGTTPQNALPFALARCLYNEQPCYIDMGQYTEAASASHLRQRLIDIASSGAHKVLLFGDVDRSHAVVRVLLTDLFRNAHLTDDQGNRVDLTNSIFILTTTVAADLLMTREVLNDDAQLKQVWQAMYRVFERYFIGPLSLIIPFYDGGRSA